MLINCWKKLKHLDVPELNFLERQIGLEVFFSRNLTIKKFYVQKVWDSTGFEWREYL